MFRVSSHRLRDVEMDEFRDVLEPGEVVEWQGAPVGAVRDEIGHDVRYLITDRRVLIVGGEGADSFAPATLTKLELRPAGDGTADVVWDVERTHRQPSRQPGLALRLRRIRRDDRIGFVGVADGTAVLDRLRHWLASRHAAAAASALAEEWTTVRDPGTDFRIDVPTAWAVRTGVLKETKVLGIRIQRPPKWSETPGAAWNTLEATISHVGAVIVVLVNPVTIPDSLEAVLHSRLAAAMGVRFVASDPAVRLGTLTGFSVLQDLQGTLGSQVQLGPVSVSTGGFKDGLFQSQTWLSGPAGTVHVLSVTPADGNGLREVMGRVVSTIRFGS
jgi:hypothetical protein